MVSRTAHAFRTGPPRAAEPGLMDSFELNKIMGAVLATCLVLLTLNISANALFTPSKPAKQGFAIAVPDGPAEAPGAAPAGPGDW